MKRTQVQCYCGETRALFTLFDLDDYYIVENGKERKLEKDPGAGARLSCQICGAIFSIDGSGKFRHSPKALPYPAEPSYQQEEPQADDGARQPDRPLPPLPLRAPRL